jgi:DNA-3-methyladenine glycosylase II
MLVSDIKYHLSAADPVLAPLISSQPEPAQESTHDVFYDLMSCVLEQQIHYRSTKKLFQKMLAQAGLSTLTPDTFAQFDERCLAHRSISLTKQATLSQLVDVWPSYPSNWSLLTDAEVARHLSAIKGIGQWTIDMILLYTLQRPAIFPADDYHLQQVMVRLYGIDPGSGLKSRMRSVASQWDANQSLAVRYLLDWKDIEKKRQKLHL